MPNHYEIIDLYPVSDRAGYFTLVLGATTEAKTKDMPLFGEFKLQLLDAKEMGLIDGVDDSFINNYKANEIFFGEISEQNLKSIIDHIGIDQQQVVGHYIIEL
jgi:hypothetical protein